jgi:hypothetical protein
MTRAFETMGVLLLCAAPVLAAPPGATSLPETGELWEVKSQMSMKGMEGFALPTQTSTVCADKAWKKPPVGGEDRGCQVYDVTTTGSKSSWKMKCDNPEPMTGEGEITRTGPASYTGSMKVVSAQGTMNMKLAGTRLGDCDIAATRRQQADTVSRAQAQVEAAQKQVADAQAQGCQEAASSMSLMALTMEGSPCTDPKYRTAYCANLQTRNGYTAVLKMSSPYGPNEAAAYCQANLDDTKKKFCAESMAAQTPDDLTFIGTNCPEQTQEIAKKECAGREGTAFYATKYGQFCATYAKEIMAASQPEKKEEQKPESAGKKAKKALKSIFP